MSRHPLDNVHFPVQYIEITESLARARGAPVASVREHCGLPAQDDPESPAMIDGRQLKASIELGLSHCLPGKAASLQVLDHFPLTAHGMLGMLFITCQTVGEALDAALQYHALVMPLFEMRRQQAPAQQVAVRVEQVVDFAPHNALMTELVVGVFRNVAPYTHASERPVMAVHFTHQPLGPERDYAEFFGAPVHFGATHNGFSVSNALLQSPLITGNRATRASLEALLKKQAPGGMRLRPLTQRIRQAALSAWRSGAPLHAGQVADALAMSPRTLSRRLQDEGTTLSQILDQLRIEHAEQLLLTTSRPVQEVAHHVGFADASSFSRAFKRATGQTPAELRGRSAGLIG